MNNNGLRNSSTRLQLKLYIIYRPLCKLFFNYFKPIEALADTCKTSLTATAIRYCLFSDDPVVIVMSEGSQIHWCFMSEHIKSIHGLQWIKKGSLLPSDTYTANYNKNLENILNNVREEAWTNLNEWFDDAPDIEMQEDIIGLGTYGRTLTILHTSEAIELEEEFED